MANFSFDYETINSFDHLDKTEQLLFTKATKQMDFAYAPYSSFYVGAALLLDNGEIILGSNQENASYPLCMCAERVALFSAANLYPDAKGVKMAIVAKNPKMSIEKAIPPCGACRQVILEFENRFKGQLCILLKDDLGKYYKFQSARDLLPLAFDGSFLLND